MAPLLSAHLPKDFTGITLLSPVQNRSSDSVSYTVDLTPRAVTSSWPQRIVTRTVQGTKSMTHLLAPPRVTSGRISCLNTMTVQLSVASDIPMSFSSPAWLYAEIYLPFFRYKALTRLTLGDAWRSNVFLSGVSIRWVPTRRPGEHEPSSAKLAPECGHQYAV